MRPPFRHPTHYYVIPAQAGIQTNLKAYFTCFLMIFFEYLGSGLPRAYNDGACRVGFCVFMFFLDSRLRGNDGK
jgi:hypothetical protein